MKCSKSGSVGVKGTSDFLHKLQTVGYIPSTAVLCSIDVIGLYPHIPHEKGLQTSFIMGRE